MKYFNKNYFRGDQKLESLKNDQILDYEKETNMPNVDYREYLDSVIKSNKETVGPISLASSRIQSTTQASSQQASARPSSLPSTDNNSLYKMARILNIKSSHRNHLLG